MAKQILLDCVMENHNWGLLNMYVVLNEDILKFDVSGDRSLGAQQTINPIPKFLYRNHSNMLLGILTAKCSVSNCLKHKCSITGIVHVCIRLGKLYLTQSYACNVHV